MTEPQEIMISNESPPLRESMNGSLARAMAKYIIIPIRELERI